MIRLDALKLFDALAPAAFQAFGERAQMIKTLEELSELMVTLAKKLNASPVTDAEIIDEIADVLIMVGQMRFRFGETEVDQRIIYKLNRTAAFILKNKPPESQL